MTCLSTHALLFAAVVAVAPMPALAQLYKWVDADGTINYGDAPPKGAKDVRVLGKDAGNLTVVPGIPAEQRDRLREREEQHEQQHCGSHDECLLSDWMTIRIGG